MMEYTSKVFKYLQKVFSITKCNNNYSDQSYILSDVELEVKKVVYGKSSDFTLHNLKIGKT